MKCRPVGLLVVGLMVSGMADARVTAAMDPTRPPAAVALDSAPGAMVWRLGSVLVSEQRRVAVVNGRVVAQGDLVAGARVARIDEDGVLLRPIDGGAPVLLTLDTIKVRSGSSRMARAPTGRGASGR